MCELPKFNPKKKKKGENDAFLIEIVKPRFRARIPKSSRLGDTYLESHGREEQELWRKWEREKLEEAKFKFKLKFLAFGDGDEEEDEEEEEHEAKIANTGEDKVAAIFGPFFVKLSLREATWRNENGRNQSLETIRKERLPNWAAGYILRRRKSREITFGSWRERYLFAEDREERLFLLSFCEESWAWQGRRAYSLAHVRNLDMTSRLNGPECRMGS